MDQHRHGQLFQDRGIHRHPLAGRDAEREGRGQITSGIRQQALGRRDGGSGLAGRATAIVGGMKVSRIGVRLRPAPQCPEPRRRRSVRLGFANVSDGCVLFVLRRQPGCDRRSFDGCRRLGDIGRHGGVRRVPLFPQPLPVTPGHRRLDVKSPPWRRNRCPARARHRSRRQTARRAAYGRCRRVAMPARSFFSGKAALPLQPITDLAEGNALTRRQTLLAIRRTVLRQADDLVGKAPLLLRHDRQDRHFAPERIFGLRVASLPALVSGVATSLDGEASSSSLAFAKVSPAASGSTIASPARATPKPRKPLKLRSRS